ncbi:MAG: hypothetical protein GY844_18040 [Bradyrhizobium sp.]|nr:hypothetical protein [Bradyrhizobium sp.]
MEARAVSEPAPPLTTANAAEEDAPPLAKADKLDPPNFVVRLPVVPVEPAPAIANTNTQVSNTQASKTEAVTTWHWRAGSKKIHKSTGERDR